MSFIRYTLDDRFRLPVFWADDHRYQVLGSWIVTDVGHTPSGALAALAVIEDVANEVESAEELSGEGYTVTRLADDLKFTPELASGEAKYTIDEVREALEDYWEFISRLPDNATIREYRPDLPGWQAALLMWEEQHGRPHPYGDRLFQPPS
ncbi:hypothetical protein [Kribbella sp. VKM Ac-2566]|uniref:hypothetical protein n=1 Tax=Kribbella sp. VKM Ac-2566 TaxID=2512218 RepID=UPI0010632975|nr:hypothetical protein [Kribbella sp. VKM Ac-2566]TDX08400.1 hypothetical protein EV647_0321 [Kribbella sp. VKM Ac-2566]